MSEYETKVADSGVLSPQVGETFAEGSGGGAGRSRARARVERRATLTPAQKRADTIAARRRSARAAQGVATRRANAEARRRAALTPQQRAAETRRARRQGLPGK